jgi:antitoxin PrlF
MYEFFNPSAPTISFTGEDFQVFSEALGDEHSLIKLLNFLAADINDHPERLQVVDSRLVDQINLLVLDVVVDLDLPLQATDD